MHNNVLIDRGGKMSKSSGDFLRLQLLVDRGYHPLAFRLMCLQAHYRSELEFSWESLGAALTRLKRMVMAAARLPADGAPIRNKGLLAELEAFDAAVADDLNLPKALTHFETALATKAFPAPERRTAVAQMDAALGLDVLTLARTDLRVRPSDARIDAAGIVARLEARKAARAEKNFAESDRLRDELKTLGVDVMDGDPLEWEWSL
jgi:cysteinyl-tRNA synthetase